MDFIIALLLVVTSFVYSKIAVKYGIIDKPNNRSSHTNPTIRGGGIIFYIAVLLFYFLYGFQYPYFLLGLTLVAIISFLDDIYTLSSSIRMVFQLGAVILTSYQVGLFDYNLFLIVLSMFTALGFLNIFNFMDGINGITGLYGLSVLCSLLFVNIYIFNFIDNHFLISSIVSLIIFGWYNFRGNAKFFAGDIGSISLGMIIIFCVGKLVVESKQISYLLFILIYMIDGGATIIERLSRKENIFKPHRRHLYQLLVDQRKYPHLKTSLWYGILQLVVCITTIITIYFFGNNIIILLGLVIISISVYLYLKNKILSK